MRTLLLIVHILAAGAWIGGSLYSGFAIPRHAADSGVPRVVAVVRYLGTRYFGAAVAVLFLSGVGLVLVSDVIGWGTAFVLIGIGVVVLDGVLDGTIFDRRLKEHAASENSVETFGRTVKGAAVVHFALLVVAVWAMVVKPGM